jgi:hypothetical protein
MSPGDQRSFKPPLETARNPKSPNQETVITLDDVKVFEHAMEQAD